jgi:hypothetical protein
MQREYFTRRKKKLISIEGGGVQLDPFGTAANNRPLVSAPGDYGDGEIGGMIGRGKQSNSEKTCPSAALSTTNPTCCPDAKPGRRGGKPATKSLSYGTASVGVAPRLWAGPLMIWGSISCKGKKFSVLHNIQIGSGAHPATCRIGTRGCFPGFIVAVARSRPLTSI